MNCQQGVLTIGKGFLLSTNMLIARADWIVAAFVVAMISSSSLAQSIGEDDRVLRVEKTFAAPKNMVRLDPKDRVWVDRKNRRVVVDGYVALRRGQLEMFACPQGTKEHESIVAVLSSSQLVHAGLLAAGALPGKPTAFEPYRPATGSTVRVEVLWKEENGQRKTATAQSWILHAGQQKTMSYDWVFAGSGIYKDKETGKETYLGDAGDLLCVANFPSATLDIAVQSDSSASGLVFAANTDEIPAEGTPVRLVLQVSDDPPSRNALTPEVPKGPVRDILVPPAKER